MIVVVAALGLALALLAVLVAGLLRSHADILRALHALGVPAGGDSQPAASEPRSAAVGLMSPRDETTAVFDVAGVTPFDEAISVAVVSARVDTLLAFLSAGCSTCMQL